MPLMVYLALDDPTELSRADFVRLGLLRARRGQFAAVLGAFAGEIRSGFCDEVLGA